MKKFLSVLLSVILVISICPFGLMNITASAETEGIYTYEVYNGKVTITGCNSSASGSITIPSTLGGYPVTSIGYYAFSWREGLTSITIPNSVTSIEDYAFCVCTGLTSVTIGNGVTSIGDDAFVYCESLTSITIPNGVTSIGSYAFKFCTGLTSITIPDSVTSIGEYAFYDTAWYNNQPKGLVYAGKVAYMYKGTCPANVTIKGGTVGIAEGAFSGCESLTSITIPNSVTSIGEYAFQSCTGLTSITIPNSVKSIGYNAFYSTAWYNNQPDGLVYAGKVAYNCKGTYPANVTIKGGTVGIAEAAFYGCTGLTSITIPNSVTSIGDWAFAGCTGLTSVTIGNGVTSIGDFAFRDCTRLTSITIPNSVTSIGDLAFFWCGLTNVYYDGTAEDRANISIGDDNECLLGAIWHYNSTGPEVCEHTPAAAVIENHIPATCVNAGSYDTVVCCFICGEELSREHVVVPATGEHSLVNNYDGVLHTATCQNCDYTEVQEFTYTVSDGKAIITKCDTSVSGDVTIPSNLGGYPVTVISASAFRDCSGITSVTMPNTVTDIGNYAFRGCTALSSVTISDNATYIGLGAFRDTALTSVTIPDSAVTVDSYSFYNCTGLKTAVIGSSVTTIGMEAFRNCTALTTVTLGGSLTSVGENAFSGCTALNRVNILGNMANWCKISFNGYKANPLYFAKNLYLNDELVTDVIIPDSVNTIGSYAFYGYKKITSITIGNSVESIGDSAFMGCTAVTSITVSPENTVYHSAGNCLIETNSKTLIFGCNSSVIPNDGTVTSIASYAFYYCTGLKSVVIPNSVTTIGRYAFEACSGLESLTLSNSLTELVCVFRGCSKLTSIVIPDSVTTIGDRAFMTCTSITSITIPVSVTVIENNAFAGCSSSADVYYLGTEAQRSGITIDSGNALNTMAWHCLGIPRDTMRNNTGFIKNKFEFATFNEQNKHEISFDSAKDITDTKMIELDVYVNGEEFDTGIAICDSLGNSALYNFTGLTTGWNHLAVRVSDLVQNVDNTANVNLSNIAKCVLSGNAGEEVTVANLYAADYVEGDANRDGEFDLKDIVRAKKMAAGITTEGNKLAVSGDDYEINAVDLTNLIHSIIDSLFV